MVSIKNPKEIEILKEGGRIHAEILKKIEAMVAPGVSTNELNNLVLELLKKSGDIPSFLNYRPVGARRRYPAALCVSINDEIVHGIPNENPTVLKEGDIVSLDLGVRHKGMVTDAAITVAVGKITKRDEELILATKESLWAGINEAKAGNYIGDIGFAIETEAKKRKFKIVEGLAGHGVGYEVHEDPFVPNTGNPGEGEMLVSGMVLAIEPMLTDGNGKIILDKDGYTYKTSDRTNAAHFEHTVVITEDEPIVLTRF